MDLASKRTAGLCTFSLKDTAQRGGAAVVQLQSDPSLPLMGLQCAENLPANTDGKHVGERVRGCTWSLAGYWSIVQSSDQD